MVQIEKEKKIISQSKNAIAIILKACVLFHFIFCFQSLYPEPAYAYLAKADPITNSPQKTKEDISADEEQAEIIKEHLREARDYYENGRYGEAIESWKDILALRADEQQAKEGIALAEKKIAKINEFFGRDVFEGPQYISKLSLYDCIEIAEERSLLFQIAEEQINLAKIKVWEARRAFLPSLTLSWTKTGGKRDDKIEGIEYGVEGKQPAFRSGELIHTMAQSKANLNIAEKNYDKVRMELYFEVAEAYYSFVKAKKFREFIKDLYDSVKPLYKMAHDKHKEAVSSDIEFLSAESKFNQIYYRNVSADNDFDLARLELEQKLNMKDIGVIDIEISTEEKVVDKNIDTCLSMAMENRPDLKMSEFTVKSTEYGKKIAEARGLPQLDLTGYYKKASEVTEPNALDPQKKWYAGLEANWPLLGSTGTYSLYKKEDTSTVSTYYAGAMSKGTMVKLGILDNLKQFSEEQEAEIAHARAEEELNETRKNVVMEVKEAFYEYEKARIQLEAAEAQKEFRKKELKILEAKHGLGEIELSELFESMLGLAEASETYFEAERDLNISVAALSKAIGMEDYF